MLRETFSRNLRKLQDEILRTGSEVEENLLKVVDAFIRRDLTASQQLIKADEWVNERRVEIGMNSLRLIATQQPIAGDMRLIAATLEIIGELERIHDYVKGIGKISLMIADEDFPDELVEHMPKMAEKTVSMLHRALDAYTTGDTSLAYAIPQEDDEVDRLYYKTHETVIAFVMKHPAKVQKAHRIEWVAHNLERSADRVTNICEWVIYMGTGKYVELD